MREPRFTRFNRFSWFSVRRLFRRDRDAAESDLADEIRFHLDHETQLRIDRGLPPARARQNARRDFGNVTLVTETTRQMWGRRPMMLTDDLKHGFRRLRARPSTALAAAGMLALGIGLTTGMFTVVDALVLHPTPFRDVDHLASLSTLTRNTGRNAVSAAVLDAWRVSPVFSAVEGASVETSILDTGNGPKVEQVARVSTGLFEMLGVHPSRGRAFEAAEGRAGNDDSVLLSEDLWRGALGGDPNLVGQRITLDGASVRVVGLMPAGFRFPEWNTVMWRPIDFTAPPPAEVDASPRPFVRIAPGVPIDDVLKLAKEAAQRVDPSILPATQIVRRAFAGIEVDPYYQRAVPLLGGGVALVFLVLCANVSSLLLARLTARQREFHMCSALGASRARLLRQSFIEHALLGFGGATLGVGLAWSLVSLARSVLPAAFLVRTLHPIDLDLRALGVAVAAGLAATLAAGLLPAWIGTRGARGSSISGADRGGTESAAARRLTRGLLVTEVALACTLLAGAMLLVRSFINLASSDRGLQTDGVLTTWIALPQKVAPDRASRLAIAAALEDDVRRLPGVSRIALSGGLPPGGYATYFYDDWRGDEPDAKPVHLVAHSLSVSADFFDLYGIPVLRGRAFHAGDAADTAVVGERIATVLFPGQDPIGRAFSFDSGKQAFRIIGVAREIHLPSVDPRRDLPQFYVPFTAGGAYVYLNIRCEGSCPGEAVLRRQILASVPGANIVRLGLLSDLYGEELARPRGAAALGSTFAVIAVLAAAGGLFSVLSYAVGRRRREFGIRTALGATPAQIRRLVLGEGLKVAALGIAIGIAAAASLARVIASVEYGVTTLDPVTWAAVLGLLAATTIAASWRPAHRATRVDPVALLRDE